MSTDTPDTSWLPPSYPAPPTIESALSHLVYLNAVDVAGFTAWMVHNPGGVCQLIDALIARLPTDCKSAQLTALRRLATQAKENQS